MKGERRLARWVETSDPASQVESRALPLDSGVIGEQTTVRIPSTLYHKLKSASPEAQRAFDILATRMSHVFPFWKGTRDDFRFSNSDERVVFILTPTTNYIRVEIHPGLTGYRNRQHLFPEETSPRSGYPGIALWPRVRVSGSSEAAAIADDVERGIR